MTITLTAGAIALALDPDLLWDDEFAWAATEQSFTRGLTGKPIIQAALRQAGRPITLRNEDDSSAWMTRADMAQLQAWADTPDLRLTLTLRGTAYLVVFRHHDGGPFEARPLVHYADPVPADWVLATLRFMTVTE
ncbi:hypothetical protein [Aromatoleum tolulyticum]|nr:hypothetical protein [Aromatoleum tolulyticum]